MLRPFFDWFQQLAFSVAFRQSTWMFPIVDALHLLALVVFAGAVLLVDLRLLGAILTNRSLAVIARDAERWLIGSFIALALTGTLMILGNGDKYYYSDFFWQKMVVLGVGLVHTFTFRLWATRTDEQRVRPFWRRTAGATSIVVWLFVAVWGRLIGFL